MKKLRCFLGGTCAGSLWREALIPMLTIGYFNPVVPDWNDEAHQRELNERETCDFCLYVITPKMTGVYSIAEAVDDSNKRPAKTVFCYLGQDVFGHSNTDKSETSNPQQPEFEAHQLKALSATAKMIVRNGGVAFTSLEEVAAFLNQA